MQSCIENVYFPLQNLGISDFLAVLLYRLLCISLPVSLYSRKNERFCCLFSQLGSIRFQSLHPSRPEDLNISCFFFPPLLI